MYMYICVYIYIYIYIQGDSPTFKRIAELLPAKARRARARRTSGSGFFLAVHALRRL